MGLWCEGKSVVDGREQVAGVWLLVDGWIVSFVCLDSLDEIMIYHTWKFPKLSYI
jgi:hypothetical protein